MTEEPRGRHPEIDAALAEGLADIQAGRVSPSFEDMKALEAWLKTAEYKKFVKE
jgi:predicted transcriptional regulator